MKINDYIEKLNDLNACPGAIDWSLSFKTSQDAWDNCERGDWMLWLIGKLAGEKGGDKRKSLVLTTCKCARLALKYAPEKDLRPLRAIETAEAWARGENITLEEVRKAAAAYTAAAYAAAAAYADAADAAYSAADAAYSAAAYAADAAYAAAADRKATLKKCAEIVRADYPNINVLLEEKS